VDEVDSDSLMKGAYEGMLSGLDPFSEYFTPEEYAAYQAYSGKDKAAAGGTKHAGADVGLRLARKDGAVLVVAVKPGSDAEQRGITPGDFVRRLGGDSAREMHMFQIESLMDGVAGSTLAIQVARREEPRKIETDLARKQTPPGQPSLTVQDQAAGIAVLKIPHFLPGAAQAVAGQLERARKQRVSRLLIDLRGNAWGSMDEAARTAGLFLGDAVVARLKGKNDVVRELRGGRGKEETTASISLLVSSSTAEAAEMFAAALHDGRSATIMGETTFGVGAEQEFIALNNGGWLRLSTRKYVSPAGTAWHGTGLKPGELIPAGGEGTMSQRMERQLQKAVDRVRTEKAASAAPSRGEPGAL